MNDPEVFSRLSRLGPALVPPPLKSSELDAFDLSIAPFRLTRELRDFYSTCNGYYIDGDDPDTASGILSLARARSEADMLTGTMRATGHEFPRGLLPIFGGEGLTLLAVLGKEYLQESMIVSWHIEDNEMYLDYQSFRRFVETKLAEAEVQSRNAYPGTVGHYPDREAAEAICTRLNPDAWQPEQKGHYSPSGVRNVFVLGELPAEWF